jgi:hypothetical protein
MMSISLKSKTVSFKHPDMASIVTSTVTVSSAAGITTTTTTTSLPSSTVIPQPPTHRTEFTIVGTDLDGTFLANDPAGSRLPCIPTAENMASFQKLDKMGVTLALISGEEFRGIDWC